MKKSYKIFQKSYKIFQKSYKILQKSYKIFKNLTKKSYKIFSKILYDFQKSYTIFGKSYKIFKNLIRFKESSSKRCRYGGVGYIFDHTDGRNAYFDKRFEMERLLGTFECPKKFQLVSTIFQHVVTPLEKKFHQNIEKSGLG